MTVEQKKALVEFMVERELVEDRDEAIFQIRRGRVQLDGRIVYDEELPVTTGSAIKLLVGKPRFVSRGGLKLEFALRAFNHDVAGKKCVDIGASTGGFTDCLLAHGASKVYSVDVGYGILDWQLRNHPRVVVLERTNARYLNIETICEKVSLITIDVNHISAVTIAEPLKLLLDIDGRFLVLIKPQFEISRDLCREPGFQRGVIKNDELLYHVVDSTITKFKEKHIICSEPIECSIKGASGNREFFVLASARM